MRFIGKMVLSMLAIGVSIVPVLAQTVPSIAATSLAPTGEFAPALTISRRVDEVNLAFTVTDKKGRFITNLSPADFQVLDNLQSPSSIDFFQQQTDLPLRVGLLIDASDSIKYRFGFECVAASTFLKNILRPGKDQAFILSFDGRVHLMHGFSDDVRDLSRSVRKIHPGGDTALYDAVVYASNLLKNVPSEARRAIIVITDGEDTHSRSLMSEAGQAAARAQVTLFALSTNDLSYGQYPRGEAVLDLLSLPTGGRILPAHDEAHLGQALRAVELTLRNQYALGYHPSGFTPDGSFHHVQLTPLRKGLRIQCRKGYYARQEDARNLAPPAR